MQILYDDANPKAVRLRDFLEGQRRSLDGEDHIFLVLGGDGFMLRSVRENYREEAVFLGLNCGSIGFLMNEVPEDLDALVVTLGQRRFQFHRFPRLQMEAVDREGRPHAAYAVNDIYLERMIAQASHLRLQVDGITVVEKMVCDGVIICTAVGSTAYSFSSGGPVCHPSLETLCVTPICPHTPKLSPTVLPLQSIVSLESLDPNKRKSQAVADGVVFHDIVQMTVRTADSPVQLAYLEGHNYTAAVINKVLRV